MAWKFERIPNGKPPSPAFYEQLRDTETGSIIMYAQDAEGYQSWFAALSDEHKAMIEAVPEMYKMLKRVRGVLDFDGETLMLEQIDEVIKRADGTHF